MALAALAVHDVAESILGCVCATLARTAAENEDYPGCPCNSCVVAGTVAWDSCDDPCGNAEVGGQLTVSLARMYLTTEFPVSGAQSRASVLGDRNCMPATTAAEFIITLLRCAPGPSENGCPPTCEELSAAARILHMDTTAVHNALVCCFPTTSSRRRGRRYVIGDLRPVGPQGNCVGLEQRLTVALPSCACPEEGES